MQGAGGGNGGGESHAAATYPTMRSRPAGAGLGDLHRPPLVVGVVLVLLLIFMVTAHMMSRGIDVSLPVADQPNITPEDRPVTVVVNARGTAYINDKPAALPPPEDQL